MTIWHVLFMIAAYLSFALCLYVAAKQPVPDASFDTVVLVLFVIGYWLLESWATHVGDYYFYPPVFLDMIPYFQWGSISWVSGGEGLLCPWFCPVVDIPCESLDTDGGISLSIPVLEASATFAGLWTARILAPKLMLFWPFLVGLALLCIDLFLDPIASTSAHCVEGTSFHGGLGFWEWRVHSGLWLDWFGVPLFNWAAWLFAPICAVAAALLLQWVLSYSKWLAGVSGAGFPGLLPLLLRAIIFGAFGLLLFVSPFGGAVIPIKVAVMVLVVVASVVAAIHYRSQYVYGSAFRLAVVIPLVIFFVFSLVALLFSGAMPILPLILYGLLLMALGVLYALAPYS